MATEWKKEKMENEIMIHNSEELKDKIYIVRNQQVMLDVQKFHIKLGLEA